VVLIKKFPCVSREKRLLTANREGRPESDEKGKCFREIPELDRFVFEEMVGEKL